MTFMEKSYIRVLVGAMDSADRVIAVDWSATLPLLDYGRVARHSGAIPIGIGGHEEGFFDAKPTGRPLPRKAGLKTAPSILYLAYRATCWRVPECNHVAFFGLNV